MVGSANCSYSEKTLHIQRKLTAVNTHKSQFTVIYCTTLTVKENFAYIWTNKYITCESWRKILSTKENYTPHSACREKAPAFHTIREEKLFANKFHNPIQSPFGKSTAQNGHGHHKWYGKEERWWPPKNDQSRCKTTGTNRQSKRRKKNGKLCNCGVAIDLIIWLLYIYRTRTHSRSWLNRWAIYRLPNRK